MTLYANSSIGNNSYDGLTPIITGSHGPKENIHVAISVAFSGDRIEAAAGVYPESLWQLTTKSLTLTPVGTVTIP